MCFWAACLNRDRQPSGVPERIVSLAPSITETLFALGLGDNVVGVTSYCRYPKEAQSVEKIGGYRDINLEKVITLAPDLVILQEIHQKQKAFLDRHGITVLTANYRTIPDIRKSFHKIGSLCGAKHRADSLVNLFRSMVETKGGKRRNAPRVLLCVGRSSPGNATMKYVYGAGAGTFYHDLIVAAGGINACSDSVPVYPKLSTEGIISIAPDIIIDIASSMGAYTCSTLVKDWSTFPLPGKSYTTRVFCLHADYATIPGPRLPQLLNDLTAIVAKVRR